MHVVRSVQIFLLSLLVSAGLTALSGCATTAETVASVPPAVPQAANLQRVAVLGFSGIGANEVSAAFESLLVSHQYDGKPFFVVVDRAQTQDLMSEFASALRGEIDPETAARFGKLIGAQGVHFGDITRNTITGRSYTATQSVCASYSGKKCKSMTNQNVSCYERVASVAFVPRLVQVETGQVVYRANHEGFAKDSYCGGYGASVTDDELRQQAINMALQKILADIAPRNIALRVELMEKPSVLKGSQSAEFLRGVIFAKSKRMDRACKIWQDLDAQAQGVDDALLFNLAVCHEIAGKYIDAQNLMKQVDGRLSAPDNRVSAALNRLETTLNAK